MTVGEKRLVTVFLLLLFVAANVVVVSKLIQKKRAIDASRLELDLRRTEIEDLIEGKETWLKREAWLAENQPEFTSQEDAEKELLATADSAADFQIAVTQKDLQELEETGFARQTGIWMKTSGTLENLLRWHYQLQQPEQFRVIRGLKIGPDRKDPAQIECEFLLLRWYRVNEAKAP